MAPKRKPGRPKKPPGQLRDVDIRIPVTKEEKGLIQKAAQESTDHGELADWARSLLLDAAKKATKS